MWVPFDLVSLTILSGHYLTVIDTKHVIIIYSFCLQYQECVSVIIIIICFIFQFQNRRFESFKIGAAYFLIVYLQLTIFNYCMLEWLWSAIVRHQHSCFKTSILGEYTIIVLGTRREKNVTRKTCAGNVDQTIFQMK